MEHSRLSDAQEHGDRYPRWFLGPQRSVGAPGLSCHQLHWVPTSGPHAQGEARCPLSARWGLQAPHRQPPRPGSLGMLWLVWEAGGGQ